MIGVNYKNLIENKDIFSLMKFTGFHPNDFIFDEEFEFHIDVTLNQSYRLETTHFIYRFGLKEYFLIRWFSVDSHRLFSIEDDVHQLKS